MDRSGRRRALAPRFLFFAGKGGVGKTTCAAGAATAAAAAGARVLAVSTDPEHSLGDVLGLALSARPSQVSLRGVRSARGGALHAVEIDARRAFARWLGAHRRALGDIVEHGTWLDRGDVDALLRLSIPGLDELVGLIEIARLADLSPRAPYDIVIVDTAPTGHTLRLLAAPETVAAMARVLDALQQEHRDLRQQFARANAPEPADRLIDMLGRQARDASALLRNPRAAAFHWITLPEELSIAESEDGVGSLERAGIRISSLIVNRSTAAGPPCPVCDRRRFAERQALAALKRSLGGRRSVRFVAAVRPEPRGVAALAPIGRTVLAPARRTPHAGGVRRSPRGTAMSLPSAARTISAESLQAARGARLLFFGGKGGVGKTTTAAAAAVRLARAVPDREVLLLSTDPAHSLGDVFEQTIGDRATRITGGPANLWVREIDAGAALASRRAALAAALDEIGSAFGASGVSLATGGRGAAELVELAPPGIDELFGLLSVVEARDRFPLIVLDTAPTGHALRLLEMPGTARDWVNLLLRVLLKYRGLVRPGRLAAELVGVSKSIRALQTMMRDARQTRFIPVTRAAAVTRIETGRLLSRLRRLHLAAPALVVNAVTLAPGRCPNCRSTAAAERGEIDKLWRLNGPHRRAPGYAVIETPLTAPPPRGIAALERWAQSWIMAPP